jgi:phosphohistidine phosphatase
MCVGHNPTISYLAEYLTKKEVGDMALAGIVIIEYIIYSWTEVKEGNGALVRYIHPTNLPQD